MIAKRIKELREQCGLSQADLARKLDVSRSSVNAWEMELSTPTTQYVVDMARLFHVTTDYLLAQDDQRCIALVDYTPEEIKLVNDLVSYIDSKKSR